MSWGGESYDYHLHRTACSTRTVGAERDGAEDRGAIVCGRLRDSLIVDRARDERESGGIRLRDNECGFCSLGGFSNGGCAALD